MKGRAKSFWIFLLPLALVMLAWGWTASAGQADPAARLIDGAKKEGALVWYTALNLNDSEMLTKRFEQIYPFIKTDTLRLSSFSLLSKIQTEARAGAFKADVIEIAGVLGHILKKDGLFAKYVSPESRFYPDSVKDPDGTWTSFFMNTHVLSYNTKLVKKDELPKTYEEVINPKWKDKITMSEDFDIFGMMLKTMGRAKGLEFMRRLAAQGVVLKNSYSLAIQAVASDEVALGLNVYGTRTKSSRRRERPSTGCRLNLPSLLWSHWLSAPRLPIRIRPGCLSISCCQRKPRLLCGSVFAFRLVRMCCRIRRSSPRA